MRRFFSSPLHFARPRVLAALASLCLGAAVASNALAAQSGFQSMTVAGEDPIPVLLFYPTSAAARPIPMGPWTVEAAPGAPADQALKGLIVLSHGTGGSEIGHHQLATGLASAGYLVASLRHPHDNWQDRSMVGSLRYFTERPAQASRVIDAVLTNPLGRRACRPGASARWGIRPAASRCWHWPAPRRCRSAPPATAGRCRTTRASARWRAGRMAWAELRRLRPPQALQPLLPRPQPVRRPSRRRCAPPTRG